jgi:hypothetical protein
MNRLRIWTPEEDALLRSMAAAGESARAIARPLKRTPFSVRGRARTLKIKLASVPRALRPLDAGLDRA